MFSQKKNKKFSYQSRFSKDDNSASKLKESLNTSWNDTRRTYSSSKGNRLFLLIGVLIVIGIVMYYLETKIN